MAKPSMDTRQGTRDIPANEWIPFLANFTHENRGAHAVWRCSGREWGARLRPKIVHSTEFQGRERRPKYRVDRVRLDPGRSFHARRSRCDGDPVRAATVDSGAAIEVDTRDGITTLLILSRPEEYALPGR